MGTGEKGIQLIQHYESCVLTSYPDTGGVWTIGWGNTSYQSGAKVKEGDTITQQAADTLFSESLIRYEQMVTSKVQRYLLQNQFDACVSFAYNAGTSYKSCGRWRDYDIWKKVSKSVITPEYWHNLAKTSGGEISDGLIRRRKSEANLYFNNEVRFFK